jgi:hypothetical protein
MAEKNKKVSVKEDRSVITSYKAYMKKYLPKRYAREERLESIPKSMNR